MFVFKRSCLATIALVLIAGVGGVAQSPKSDRHSTPTEGSAQPAAPPRAKFAAPAAPQGAQSEGPSLPMIGGIVSVGLNVEASRLFGDSGFIPPDTTGAVGPNHIVEFINGAFKVLDKTTGAQVQLSSLQSFWTTKAGPVTTNGTIFDPKIFFDSATGRWFATSEDGAIDADDDGVNEVSNHFFIARSDTDDPTGDWDSVTVVADTVGVIEFHDYPQVGLDADGLFICTQDFGDGGHESCYSIPKADLLLNVPTAANLTRFEATPAGLPATDGSWQPVRNAGLSIGHEPLLGTTGGVLHRTDIFGANAGGATLGSASGIGADPGHTAPPDDARQPDDSDSGDGIEGIENVAPRFVSNPVLVGGSIWAVHAVHGSGSNSALRWYEINEATNAIVQTGLINDVNVDFHEPSIAVNQFGHVVIGYTCSGPNLAASVCVSVGTTTGGVTTFVAPAIVFAGSGTYYQDFCTPPGCDERNRWGDYSATVIDPVDPATFWVFQEYTAQDAGNVDVGPGEAEGGLWGVRVVELTFNELTGGDLSVVKNCTPDVGLFAGQTGKCEMNVTNFGPNSVLNVMLNDNFLSNGTFTLGTPTTTKGSCTTSPNPQVAAGSLNCSLGRLDPNETVLIKVDVSANTPQTVNDDAKVTTESSDPNASNNEDQDSLIFAGNADLSITKTDSPDPVVAGMNLHYDITVINNGPSPAVNVVVSDLLSASLTVVSVLGSGGAASCNAGIPGSVPTTCTFASMPNAAVRTMAIVAKVDPSVPSGTVLSNNASVASDTADNNNSNNLATTTTTVITSADLRITKADSPDPVFAGGNLTYVLNVANLGPSWARQVAVSDALPAQVTFVSATIGGGSGVCSPVGSPVVVQCTLGDIADGSTRDITIQTKVLSSVANGSNIHNSANVSSPTPDPVAGNNTATSDTTVQTQADIWLDKTGVQLSGNPSRTVRFTLNVFNKPGCESDDVLSCGNGGPSDAQGVVVTDTLPLDPKKVSVVFMSQNCTYNQTLHNVVCTVAGALPAGQVATFTIDISVAGSVGSIINSARVTTTTTDPNLVNNSDSMQLVIKGGSNHK